MLRIAKISMRYKKKLTDKQKAAHIIRLRKAHYADVLCAKERVCHRHSTRSCTSKEILECMTSAWKMRGGIPNEGSNARQQMNWLLRTSRLKTREDLKVSVINVARKVTRQLIAGPSSRIVVTRLTLQEATIKRLALSADGKVIPRPSATVSLGTQDMRSS